MSIKVSAETAKEKEKGSHPSTKVVNQPVRKKDAMALVTGKPVFLDDVTLRDVEEALGVSVVPVMQDGAELLRAILGD